MTTLVRQPGWEERLDAYVAKTRQSPFSWVDLHCGGFAARCVDAMTGSTFAAEIGGFEGPTAAGRWLVREGGLKNAVTSRLGEPNHEGNVKHGDVVLLLSGQEAWPRALGVVGRGEVLAPGRERLEVLKSVLVYTVWRLPWPT